MAGVQNFKSVALGIEMEEQSCHISALRFDSFGKMQGVQLRSDFSEGNACRDHRAESGAKRTRHHGRGEPFPGYVCHDHYLFAQKVEKQTSR